MQCNYRGSMLVGMLLVVGNILNATTKTTQVIPEKHMVVIAAGYNNNILQNGNIRWQRNIDSIIQQRYTNYEVFYIDDGSTDNTFERVYNYVHEHKQEHRFTFIRTPSKHSALYSQYMAIAVCKPDSIIVICDADDAFCGHNVLSHVNQVYADPAVWMTYGQFIEVPSRVLGFNCPMPSNVVARNAFRQYVHIPSHLRTFYAGLFHQIKREDLIYEGEFLPMSGDMGTMIPMIEMARNGHFRFIPEVLYEYTDNNELSDHRRSKEMQVRIDRWVRSRKPYEALDRLW